MADKSIVVGFMTAQTKAINATVISAGLEQGTTNSLVAKLNAAHEKASQASSFVLTVQPKLVDNMLNASDNQLGSFINQVQALQGKKIPQQLANGLIDSAQNLIQDSTLSGPSLAPLIPLTDLVLFNQLFMEIRTGNQAVQVAVQNLTNAGFSVTVKVDSILILLCGGTLVGCLIIGVGATAIAQSLTVITVNEMAAKGHPLTNDEIVKLALINEVIFLAIAFGLFALGEVLAPLVATVMAEAVGALPVGTTAASTLARIYGDHAIEAFVASAFGQQLEQSILGLIVSTLAPSSPPTTFVSSCGSLGTSTSCSLSSLSVGNVIVVLAEASSDSTSLTSVMSISDGSDTFTKQAQIQESTGEPTFHKVIDVEIWTATTSLTGTQTISVTFAGGIINIGTMQAISLAGASPTPIFSATGSCASIPAGCSKTITTSSSNMFSVGRVAVATAIDIAGDGVSPGSQYTIQTSGEGQAEYSSSVSSPTNYPFISTVNPDAFVDIGAIF